MEQVLRRAPDSIAPELREIRETTRGSLEEARRISARLRPEAPDDLGLVNALSVLVDRLNEQTGATIEQHLRDDLPPLSREVELVLYRVAQEALTNALVTLGQAGSCSSSTTGPGSSRSGWLTTAASLGRRHRAAGCTACASARCWWGHS